MTKFYCATFFLFFKKKKNANPHSKVRQQERLFCILMRPIKYEYFTMLLMSQKGQKHKFSTNVRNIVFKQLFYFFNFK